MTENDNDKLNGIERLKNKLFSKDYQTEIEYRDSFSDLPESKVRQSWSEPIKEKAKGVFVNFFKNTSTFKKFFIFSIAFFVLAILYVGYMVFLGGNTVSNVNIEISVFGNTFTDGGEVLPLNIEVVNKNNSTLELVDLVVEYPKGSEGDLTQDTERLRASLGSIEPGEVVNENVNVILFGQAGSIRPVRISVEYRIENSNSIFVKDKMYEVSINSTPIDIALDAPSGISPNQDITLNIKSVLNAAREVDNVLLKLDYPVGFEFTSSVPAPSLGNNVWDLGEMVPGEEQEISISGKMVDVFDGEEKTFHISTGLQSTNDKANIDVVYNYLAHTVAIERPFLDLSLVIGGRSGQEFASASGATISGQIRWRNNLNTPISDLAIRAKFSGNALDRRSVESREGFYNSSENSIIWDRNSKTDFGLIDPGESGSLGFTVLPLPLVPDSDSVLIDPTIQVEIFISGKQLLAGNVEKDLQSSETKIVRIASDVSFSSRAYYFTGPFQNSGPIPPRVERETTYTIIWSINNSSNNLSKVQLRSSLPTWITFTGAVSPASENVAYNSATREVVWNVGNVTRGAGIVGPPKEVAFQISFLPSLSQLDQVPDILNSTTLTAQDNFAGSSFNITKDLLTTELGFDSQFPNSGAKVIE